MNKYLKIFIITLLFSRLDNLFAQILKPKSTLENFQQLVLTPEERNLDNPGRAQKSYRARLRSEKYRISGLEDSIKENEDAIAKNLEDQDTIVKDIKNTQQVIKDKNAELASKQTLLLAKKAQTSWAKNLQPIDLPKQISVLENEIKEIQIKINTENQTLASKNQSLDGLHIAIKADQSSLDDRKKNLKESMQQIKDAMAGKPVKDWGAFSFSTVVEGKLIESGPTWEELEKARAPKIAKKPPTITCPIIPDIKKEPQKYMEVYFKASEACRKRFSKLITDPKQLAAIRAKTEVKKIGEGLTKFADVLKDPANIKKYIKEDDVKRGLKKAEDFFKQAATIIDSIAQNPANIKKYIPKAERDKIEKLFNDAAKDIELLIKDPGKFGTTRILPELNKIVNSLKAAKKTVTDIVKKTA